MLYNYDNFDLSCSETVFTMLRGTLKERLKSDENLLIHMFKDPVFDEESCDFVPAVSGYSLNYYRFEIKVRFAFMRDCIIREIFRLGYCPIFDDSEIFANWYLIQVEPRLILDYLDENFSSLIPDDVGENHSGGLFDTWKEVRTSFCYDEVEGYFPSYVRSLITDDLKRI